MKFKTAIPAGLRLNIGFDQDGLLEFGDGYTLASFWASKSGTYDLSFGNNQREALQYLNSAQGVLVVYDKSGKYLTFIQSSDFKDIFQYNGSVVILEGLSKYHYFDLTTKKLVVKNVSFSFAVGKVGSSKLNEVTDDVAIITLDYYENTPQYDVDKFLILLKQYYNSFNPAVKVTKKLGGTKGVYRYQVNIMINKNFEVEGIERYWFAPMNQYGYKQLFPENDKFKIEKVLIP